MISVLLMLNLFGCPIDGSDIVRQPQVTRVTADKPTPPAANNLGEEKLYQLMYNSEVGPEVHSLAQRVRILAWLAKMELTDAQLEQLKSLAGEIHQSQEDHNARIASFGAVEKTLYAPIYEELAHKLSDGRTPNEATLDHYARRLGKAQTEAATQGDMAAEQLERIGELIESASRFSDSLSHEQQMTLSHCRFFLQRRLSPLLNPTDYLTLVGVAWDGGDFRGVGTIVRPDEESHMNIGGLWTTEQLRAPPEGYLLKTQLSIILIMACLEAQLIPSIDVLLGNRPVLPIEAATGPQTPTPSDKGDAD